MGRAHEVRAKAMAATAAARSSLFMRASKEIYMAAKSGEPDPSMNLALRSAIEKWKGQNVTKDVIDRAIQKAKGGSAESYTAGRYEGFAQGSSALIVDTLSDNSNRAYVEVRSAFKKKGGNLGNPGSVSFNFTEYGVIEFDGGNRDEIEENLIMADVDVAEVLDDEGYITVHTAPAALNAAKEVLNGMGITEFDTNEIKMVPNELVELDAEEEEKFKGLLDILNECEDVQAVYHNVKLHD
jgi:YebC/PmpR family DNA-binding regulatory protein